MTKRSLLLVDGDAKSLRVLEVSLRKAGFTVSTAESGQSALQLLESMRPDLVISDTDMPGMDGYEFCRQFKSKAQWKDVPFIFLTGQTEIADKIRGLELGVDDYLTKPIYIKEILTRVRILLQKHDRARFEQKKENNTRFAGQLSDMGVVDLIQTIEVSRKTGVIHFRADERRQATMFFKDGKVIDAEAGHLQGEDAVYRLLTWSEGEFEALFRPVRRKAVIAMSSQSLLMEGMRRLDEWGRLQEQLPPLTEKFQVVYDELWDRLAELPDDINQILRLFDTRRTLQEVIDGADIGDLETVEIISKLYFEGIIVEVDQDKGLKSGSYPVEDLVLQARAASEAEASRSEHNWSESPAEAARKLAAIERELQEATEQDAAVKEAVEQRSSTKRPRVDDALTGLLEKAITAATPVPKAHGKAKPETKRSTAKGLAVSPLPPAKQVDSEDTAPETSIPAQTNKRPKTKPMRKMTPKQELDAAARLAEKEAATITSPVAESAIRVQEAERQAASITLPVEDAVARARAADDEATKRARDEATKTATSKIHVLPTDASTASMRAASEAEASKASPGSASETSEESSEVAKVESGEEYEADLDDLGDTTSLDDVSLGEASDADIAAAAARISAAAAAVVTPLPEGAVRSTFDRVDVVGNRSPDPYDEENSVGSTTAEIFQSDLRAAEPPLKSPIIWYALAAIAAGVLGYVAVKSMSQGDEEKATGPTAGVLSDGMSGKTVVTQPVLVFDAGSAALAVKADARAASAVLPADAAAPVVVVPPDAAPVVVAKLPPDARSSTPPITPDPPNTEPSPDDRVRELQQQARKAKRQGDRAGALILLDEALAIKRTGTTLYAKAELLLSLGDSAAAVEVAKELTNVSPRRAQGWRMLGVSSYEAKDYPGARKGFGRYLELSPNAKDREDVLTILESM